MRILLQLIVYKHLLTFYQFLCFWVLFCFFCFPYLFSKLIFLPYASIIFLRYLFLFIYFGCAVSFLVVAHGIFRCSKWDLVPPPGSKPGPPCIDSVEFYPHCVEFNLDCQGSPNNYFNKDLCVALTLHSIAFLIHF